MHATDRRQTASLLNALPRGRGHKKIRRYQKYVETEDMHDSAEYQ